jgi:hypothetical protein
MAKTGRLQREELTRLQAEKLIKEMSSINATLRLFVCEAGKDLNYLLCT